MKECPRCGSSLSAYSLSDVEAYGCDSCGWVGVPVDHQSEPKRLESWQDAIQRFQKKFAADGLEEHAERLERVEQARRDAVSAGEDDGATPDAEEAESTDADEEATAGDTDTPAEPEPSADEADGASEGSDTDTEEDEPPTETADDEGDDAAHAETDDEGDEAAHAETDDTEDDAADAADTVEKVAESDDEAAESDEEEVEVAADGAGQ
ncbi:zf-TFIIB domain-containing protein [Haloarchaeobius baliensis]|uniref:TFIIB-type zinc ribbon-containing protein n=1 Tax=Haloarchaeobius baliensis TaxID=1670458 RepID=UPI003F882E08